jgi:hypothetical protein
MKTNHRLRPLLPAALIALAAISFAPPGFAQEEAPKINVIVNDSALDELPMAARNCRCRRRTSRRSAGC